jgi:hypothetical protein
MVVAGFILVFSTALSLPWQVTVQGILHRAFDKKYPQTVVTANGLEFPVLRIACEGLKGLVDCRRMRKIIKWDFLALNCLLEKMAHGSQRYSREARWLMLHFRLVLVSLVPRHWLGLREKPAVPPRAEILQHFASLVGEGTNLVPLGKLSASDFQPSFEPVG